MNLHPLLLRQLAQLGLDEANVPSAHSWQQLLGTLNLAYQNADPSPLHAAFFQRSQDAVLVVNQQGECLAANDAAPFMFGMQFDLKRSRELRSLLPSALVDLFLNQIQQFFHQNHTGRWSYHFSDDNLTRHQEVQIAALDPAQAMLIVRDVTEQRWADEIARIAREYFKRLIQGLHVGMLIYRPDGELLLNNRQARSLLGLPENQTWDHSTAEQDVHLVQEDGTPFAGFAPLVQEFVRSGAAAYNTVIGVYRISNEERIWLLVNIRAEYNQDRLEWVTITLNDITDLRHIESALRVSEKLYQSLVNTIREVIFQIDSEGSWLFLNPAWTQITGYSLQESIGHSVLTYIHPADRELVRDELQNLRLGQRSFDLHEIRCLTKEGEIRWFNVRSDPIFSEDNILAGLTGTLTDITERKQSESQAAELAAKEKMVVALRTLLDYLSHDLRTPLSVINANLFLARRKINDAAAVQSYINVLEQQTLRLTHMINDVVTISALDNQTDTFTFSYLDLNQVIGAVVTTQEREARAKNLVIETHLANNLPLFRGDQIWLTRMLSNLLHNAIQFSSTNGAITVSTREEANGVGLVVADHGSGIDPKDLPYIFDHFYRADKSRPNAVGGAGLGLTIVKKVVEGHKGTIEVTSTPGQGTTFCIHLPLRP